MLCPWGEFRCIGQMGPREGVKGETIWGLSLWAPSSVLSLPLCLLGSQAVLVLCLPPHQSLVKSGLALLPLSLPGWPARVRRTGEGLAGRSSGPAPSWG